MIYLSSDYHFNHSKPFIYAKRGFSSVEEMNQAIIERHNSIVGRDDDVYILGDLCLGGPDSNEKNSELISSLNGHLYIVLGNHDTTSRVEMYASLSNVVEISMAKMLCYKKYHIYLTHFPALTANYNDNKKPWQKTLNFYGHTHQTSPYLNGLNMSYNVGVDAHDCYPITIEQALEQLIRGESTNEY